MKFKTGDRVLITGLPQIGFGTGEQWMVGETGRVQGTLGSMPDIYKVEVDGVRLVSYFPEDRLEYSVLDDLSKVLE